jgi:hypothetical protein
MSRKVKVGDHRLRHDPNWAGDHYCVMCGVALPIIFDGFETRPCPAWKDKDASTKTYRNGK